MVPVRTGQRPRPFLVRRLPLARGNHPNILIGHHTAPREPDGPRAVVYLAQSLATLHERVLGVIASKRARDPRRTRLRAPRGVGESRASG